MLLHGNVLTSSFVRLFVSLMYGICAVTRIIGPSVDAPSREIDAENRVLIASAPLLPCMYVCMYVCMYKCTLLLQI